jgi:hypothetical protein
MVLPLTVTVVACLAIILMTRPTLQRDVDGVVQPRTVVVLAKLSMLAAIIVGGWSIFVLIAIQLTP